MQDSSTFNGNTEIKKNLAKTTFSRHIFLFSFKWEYIQEDQKGSLTSQPQVNKFIELLQSTSRESDSSPWIKKPFQLDTALNYNEYNYFYDFTREVMYDVSPSLSILRDDDEKILYHFQYQEIENATYRIKINKNRNQKSSENTTYTLDIDSILLNVYNTGVAVLSFHLINSRYENLQSVLDINQFGRRIYAPFLGQSDGNFDLKETFASELPSEISITLDHLSIIETFNGYKNKNNLKSGPFRLPAFIQKLLSEKFRSRNFSHKNSTIKIPAEPYILISPVQDDRMFVLCWFRSPDFAIKIKAAGQKYLENKDWYKFLFVDTDSPGCGNSRMIAELIKQHTYDRWLDYGTLYGICRYAFVCLESNTFARDHMVGMYYKMIELALVQRASMLKFSDDVTRLSQLWEKKDEKQTTKEIRELYANYIRFVNKIYFREVTAQEQGIELYDQIQDRFRLKEHIKDLDQEIEELHSYASMLEDKMKRDREEERNERLELLTKMGFLFLVPSFITGYYGMNVFDDHLAPYNLYHLIGIGFAIILATFMIYFSTQFHGSRKKSITIRKCLTILSLIVVIFMMFFPVTNQRSNPGIVKDNQIPQINNEIDTTRPSNIPAENLELKSKETNDKE